MFKVIIGILFFSLFSSNALAIECAIKFGGGGKDSSWIKLKNDRVTGINDIGGPWSFIRKTNGPCDFRVYNKDRYKGTHANYGTKIISKLRIGAIGGTDKNGWKARSVVITPRKTECKIQLHETGRDTKLTSTTLYNHKQLFYGPARINNITGWSSVAAISGGSNCQYKLYNGPNFDRKFINIDRVDSLYRVGWRIRSIEITNSSAIKRSPPSPTYPPRSKQNYSEIKHIKGRCLDVAGGINKNKTNVQIYACNNSKSQQWKWNSNKEIKNEMGRCLAVSGGVIDNHSNIQIYQCNGSASQKWIKIGNNRIQNSLGLCLDIANGVNVNKTNVQLYRCKNVDAQQWL